MQRYKKNECKNQKHTLINLYELLSSWSYACFLIIGVVCSITLSNTGSINGEPFFRMIRLAHLGTKSANFDSVFLILYCISAYLYLSSMLVLLNKTTNFVFRSRVAKYMKKDSDVIVNMNEKKKEWKSAFLVIFFIGFVIVFDIINPKIIEINIQKTFFNTFTYLYRNIAYTACQFST